MNKVQLLAEEEALGGEHGEAVGWCALGRAVGAGGLADFSLLLGFPGPFLAPVFLDTGFFWDGDLAFLAGGGVMMASNFPLDPRFFASNSGWMFGNTPPLAMVTPFSS